jgi:hypothetical protein
MSALAPSTDWKEDLATDEQERFERHAQTLHTLQAQADAKTRRSGRALHRKGHLGATARFEILPDLPAVYRQGLFAAPATHEAYVRFSNGAFGPNPDAKPDVRGLAVKVCGVAGAKLIPGLEAAPTQDFLAIQSAATPFRTVDEFVNAVWAGRNPLLALPRFIGAFGPGRAFTILKKFVGSVGGKIPSLARLRFYSALPIAWGPYAAKFSFVPAGADGAGAPTSGPDFYTADLADRLARGPIVYDF